MVWISRLFVGTSQGVEVGVLDADGLGLLGETAGAGFVGKGSPIVSASWGG